METIEVCDLVDLTYGHSVGKLPYPVFMQLLQLSTVYVYLAYPFCAELEVMSVGFAIVGSNKVPIREVIKHNETVILVDFFNTQDVAEQVTCLLNNSKKRGGLGGMAREFVLRNCDLENSQFTKEQLKITPMKKAVAIASCDLVALAKTEKALSKLGIAGDAIALGFAINEVSAANQARDANKAVDMMTKWGVGFIECLA